MNASSIVRRSSRAVFALAVLAALSPPAPAQQAAAPEPAPASAPAAVDGHPSGPPIVDAKDVTVRYVRPQRSDADELVELLRSLHYRKYLVRNEDGSIAGPYVNVDGFGDLVVLHDTTHQVLVMEQALAALEQNLAAAAPPPAAATLRVQEYVPRHQSVDNLLRALNPFRRSVFNDSPTSRGAAMQVENITVLKEPALLVLRDSPENLATMTELLKRLDVPAPQVLLTCQLLRPSTQDEPLVLAEGLSADLLAGLRELVPYKDFGQVGFAALRVSVVAGRELSLRGQCDDQEFTLAIEPAGFDAASGLLSLDRCLFRVEDGQQFETGVTLRAGEDTVLGASGAVPLFVVLRITVL